MVARPGRTGSARLARGSVRAQQRRAQRMAGPTPRAFGQLKAGGSNTVFPSGKNRQPGTAHAVKPQRTALSLESSAQAEECTDANPSPEVDSDAGAFQDCPQTAEPPTIEENSVSSDEVHSENNNGDNNDGAVDAVEDHGANENTFAYLTPEDYARIAEKISDLLREIFDVLREIQKNCVVGCGSVGHLYDWGRAEEYSKKIFKILLKFNRRYNVSTKRSQDVLGKIIIRMHAGEWDKSDYEDAFEKALEHSSEKALEDSAETAACDTRKDVHYRNWYNNGCYRLPNTVKYGADSLIYPPNPKSSYEN